MMHNHYGVEELLNPSAIETVLLLTFQLNVALLRSAI